MLSALQDFATLQQTFAGRDFAIVAFPWYSHRPLCVFFNLPDQHCCQIQSMQFGQHASSCLLHIEMSKHNFATS